MFSLNIAYKIDNSKLITSNQYWLAIQVDRKNNIIEVNSEFSSEHFKFKWILYCSFLLYSLSRLNIYFDWLLNDEFVISGKYEISNDFCSSNFYNDLDVHTGMLMVGDLSMPFVLSVIFYIPYVTLPCQWP